MWARAKEEASLARHCADLLCYLVSDAIVDSHYLHLDGVNELLEDSILEHLAPARNADDLRVRAHARAHAEDPVSAARCLRGARAARRSGDARISERTALYFRDVYGHLVRIDESIDSARDLLGASLESYLSMVSRRTNDIMESLTLLSVVFLPLTFVTGFFGQDFEGLLVRNMNLMWGVIATCGVIPAGMIYRSRKRRWL